MTNTKLRKLVGTSPTSVRDLIVRLEMLGCEVVSGKHLRVYVNGKLRFTLPSSPSCPRAILNCVSDLRRVGIDVRKMTITEA